jgi:uncharacterized protein involved in outer membrane biogenesis
MNKAAKAAVIPLGIFLIGFGGIYLYLTPKRLRAIVVPELEVALSRKVSLGQLSLRLWNGFGVSIAGFRIHERDGFGNADFVTAESGNLSISLLSLITGSPDVGELRIKKPSIRVITDENGNVNYGDFLEGSESSASGSPVVLPITRVKIEDATLVKEDRRTGIVRRLEGMDYGLDLSFLPHGISLAGSLSAEAYRSTAPDNVETTLTDLVLSHQLEFRPSADRLDIKKISFSLGAFGIDISGSISALSEPVPILDVKIKQSTKSFEYADETTSAAGTLNVDLRVRGAYDPVSQPARIPTVAGKLVVTDLTARTTSLLEPVADGKLHLSFTPGRVTLDELSAKIGTSDIRLTGAFHSFESLVIHRPKSRPALTFELRSDNLDLDQMIPTVPKPPLPNQTFWSLTTPLYATQRIDMTSPVIPLLQMLDVKGKTTIKRIVSGGVVTDATALVSSKVGVFEIGEIKANMYAGVFKGDIKADLSGSAGPYLTEIAFSLVGGQANGILQNFFNLPLPIHGLMKLDFSGSGNLDSTLTLLTKTLNVEGQGSLSEGELVNWGWLRQTAGGITQLNFIDFDRIPLKNVASHFQVAEGRLTTKNLSMSAAQIPCRLNGSTELATGALNYVLSLDLPADRLSIGGVNVGRALGAFLGQSDKGSPVIPLNIKITGTSGSPKLDVFIAQGAKIKDDAAKGIREE